MEKERNKDIIVKRENKTGPRTDLCATSQELLRNFLEEKAFIDLLLLANLFLWNGSMAEDHVALRPEFESRQKAYALKSPLLDRMR